jgi:hypothetical protein
LPHLTTTDSTHPLFIMLNKEDTLLVTLTQLSHLMLTSIKMYSRTTRELTSSETGAKDSSSNHSWEHLMSAPSSLTSTQNLRQINLHQENHIFMTSHTKRKVTNSMLHLTNTFSRIKYNSTKRPKLLTD